MLIFNEVKCMSLKIKSFTNVYLKAWYSTEQVARTNGDIAQVLNRDTKYLEDIWSAIICHSDIKQNTL